MKGNIDKDKLQSAITKSKLPICSSFPCFVAKLEQDTNIRNNTD